MTTRDCVVKRISALCRERNISVNALARKSGISASTLKNIIYGASRNPGVVTLRHICDGLEITLVEFFDTEEFRAIPPEADFEEA